MKLIVGLGNPGKKYENTRHNVGFIALDKMASGFNFEKKFNAEIVKVKNIMKVEDVMFAKPQTFMNLSGESVQEIMHYYKIEPDDLTVIYDDLDINFGDHKIQKNRSSAGHNGVQSIINSIGTQDFIKVRIGIKTDDLGKIPTERFVLQKFNNDELQTVNQEIEKIIESLIFRYNIKIETRFIS